MNIQHAHERPYRTEGDVYLHRSTAQVYQLVRKRQSNCIPYITLANLTDSSKANLMLHSYEVFGQDFMHIGFNEDWRSLGANERPIVEYCSERSGCVEVHEIRRVQC